MVKQKIVIKLSMPCEKSRAKAMALVSGVAGVISVGVTGDGKDRLEVVGEGVDAVCLVCCLRNRGGARGISWYHKIPICFAPLLLRKKKFGHVGLLLVEEVKDKKKEEKKEEKKAVENKPCCPGYPYCYRHLIRPPPMVLCENPANSCSIM